MKPDFSFQKYLIREIKNSKGQSTIEFILTITFSIGFLFLFLTLGLNFTTGYIVHYATFMASRTYLVKEVASQDPGSDDNYAMAESKKVFDSYNVKKFQKGLSSSDLEFNKPGGSGKYEFVGVSVNFKRELSKFSPLGGKQEIDLTSESFIGREPVRIDCLTRICEAMTGGGDGPSLTPTGCTSGVQQMYFTTEDNGC